MLSSTVTCHKLSFDKAITNTEDNTMSIEEQFEKRGDGLLVRAPGKVNLSLLVKGKREDGYHDIESITAKIDWYDEILIERQTRLRGATPWQAEDGGQNVERPSETRIELICKGEYKVPEGEENLVYKAAKLILDTAGQKVPGLRIQDSSPSGSPLRYEKTEDGGQQNVQYPISNVEVKKIMKGKTTTPRAGSPCHF